MWGIAEVVTAELVFCVPAFPLAFRPPSPLHSLCSLLRSKITTAILPERLPSTASFTRPRTEHGQRDTDSDRHTWPYEGSDAGLTELEPVQIQRSRQKSPSVDTQTITLGGILVTTEIDIRTDTGKSSKGGKRKPEANRPEW
ncbi:hypothetical protein F4859DRAFT_393160 [Xylaria cf. heliscus]|nr:hypothetical protein F4859DRAFT_393160 [Xylaria cf. heliscus]